MPWWPFSMLQITWNKGNSFVALLSLAKGGCSQYFSSDYFVLIFRTRLLPVSYIKSSSFSKFENESDIRNIWGFARQITSHFPWETSCLMTALVSSSLKRYDFPYLLKTLAWEANKYNVKGTIRESSYSRDCNMDVTKQGVGFCSRDQNEPIRRLVH